MVKTAAAFTQKGPMNLILSKIRNFARGTFGNFDWKNSELLLFLQ